MARKKTLGQICCEAAGYVWPGREDVDHWERAAAAVKREVLRRLDENLRNYVDPETGQKLKVLTAKNKH